VKKLLIQVFILLFLMPAVLFGADSTTFTPGDVEAKTISGVPIGGVVAWKSNQVPDGWLECDGQSTAGYPELAALVGSTVPDLRGEFIRGWSHGKSGIDSGRTIGSAQGDAMRNITGSWTGHRLSMNIASASGVLGQVPTTKKVEGPDETDGKYIISNTINIDASRQVPTADENRPRNVALMYIIRAE
jgi:hypothetical protein